MRVEKPEATYLWMDLETTGLDSAEEIILEAAWIVTDQELRPLEGTLLDPLVRSCVLGYKRGEDDHELVVVEMHTTNGLWAECAASADSTWALDLGMQELVDQYDWSAGAPILAGSTPHFDRSFINKELPLLASSLHYRHFDASTLRMAVRSLGLEPTDFGDKNHRAAVDVLASLQLALYIRSLLFDGVETEISRGGEAVKGGQFDSGPRGRGFFHE